MRVNGGIAEPVKSAARDRKSDNKHHDPGLSFFLVSARLDLIMIGKLFQLHFMPDYLIR